MFVVAARVLSHQSSALLKFSVMEEGSCVTLPMDAQSARMLQRLRTAHLRCLNWSRRRPFIQFLQNLSLIKDFSHSSPPLRNERDFSESTRRESYLFDRINASDIAEDVHRRVSKRLQVLKLPHNLLPMFVVFSDLTFRRIVAGFL